MQFWALNLQNNRLTHPLLELVPPPLRKILDPPLKALIFTPGVNKALSLTQKRLQKFHVVNNNGSKPLREPYLKYVFFVVFTAGSVANNVHTVAIV